MLTQQPWKPTSIHNQAVTEAIKATVLNNAGNHRM